MSPFKRGRLAVCCGSLDAAAFSDVGFLRRMLEAAFARGLDVKPLRARLVDLGEVVAEGVAPDAERAVEHPSERQGSGVAHEFCRGADTPGSDVEVVGGLRRALGSDPT